ncbi:MAG: hypothetical protein FRX49_00412 [Trebouxia sp. A1-2]|nr:MAG: hypothetical protein FRX49_00412 [Trebouxia sp. A1-2]
MQILSRNQLFETFRLHVKHVEHTPFSTQFLLLLMQNVLGSYLIAQGGQLVMQELLLVCMAEPALHDMGTPGSLAHGGHLAGCQAARGHGHTAILRRRAAVFSVLRNSVLQASCWPARRFALLSRLAPMR